MAREIKGTGIKELERVDNSFSVLTWDESSSPFTGNHDDEIKKVLDEYKKTKQATYIRVPAEDFYDNDDAVLFFVIAPNPHICRAIKREILSLDDKNGAIARKFT